jgi:hypothetical protein
MKQKYSIYKDASNEKLIIKEYAELDKEILSLLCEESYPDEIIVAAIQSGTDALVRALRTRNMYPPSAFANKIATAVMALYENGGEQSLEIMFDDKELFEKEEEAADSEDAVDTDSEDIDELLDDEIEDVYEDKKLIKDLKSSLKVADDDAIEPDEGV